VKLTPEEVVELRELLPPHLHRWIEYVPTPEPEPEPTLEERRGMIRAERPVPPSRPAPAVVGPSAGQEKRKAEFRGLPPKPVSILDLALADEDE